MNGAAKTHSDIDWGCTHFLLPDLSEGEIITCRVSIHDLKKLAKMLTNSVADSSWMLSLDHGTQRAYKKTVDETANLLVKIFESLAQGSKITAEFGELMVSIGSARALESLLSHKSVPLAELWKPQLKQNEGFDFHTECPTPLVNFGEAKYSAKNSPHGLAITQIDKFITAEKHLRDHVHLRNLCSEGAISNLDVDAYGVIAAFSINGTSAEIILANARKSAVNMALKHSIKQVFLVGVSYEP